jgi:hypothetical protein
MGATIHPSFLAKALGAKPGSGRTQGAHSLPRLQIDQSAEGQPLRSELVYLADCDPEPLVGAV